MVCRASVTQRLDGGHWLAYHALWESAALLRADHSPFSLFAAQAFLGHLPTDCFEDELLPYVEQFGSVYETRILMSGRSGENRGFGFVVYADRETMLKVSLSQCLLKRKTFASGPVKQAELIGTLSLFAYDEYHLLLATYGSLHCLAA